MLETPDSRKFALAIAALISILVSFVAPKGRRTIALIGSMFGFIGIIGIASGIITQRWGAGPPLDGSFAIFASLLMLGFGCYAVFRAFFQKSDEHAQENNKPTD